MFLDDVAAAFTSQGFKMEASYGPIIRKDQVMIPDGSVQRFLASREQLLDEILSKGTFGEIETYTAILYILSADSPEQAVEDLRATLKQIMRTDNFGNLGRGKMPVDYGGLRFWVFEPYPRPSNISLEAGYWEPPWETKGGFHLSECELKIAAKFI